MLAEVMVFSLVFSTAMPIGGFLKWGYPQIIHLSRMFHFFSPSSHWGAPIYGNLPWWDRTMYHPWIRGTPSTRSNAPNLRWNVALGGRSRRLRPWRILWWEKLDMFSPSLDICIIYWHHVTRCEVKIGNGWLRAPHGWERNGGFLVVMGGSQSHPKSPVSNAFRPHVNTNKVYWLGFRLLRSIQIK